MNESPTDLIIRILEEIEGAEDVIVCVRYREDDEGNINYFTFSNEPDKETYLQMLHYAERAIYDTMEEGEDGE